MITDEDKKAAEEWATRALGDVSKLSDYEQGLWYSYKEGILKGIEHERKRWAKYHPEPGFNYMLPTPSNPFNIIEQVGEKHWKIKEDVPPKRWRLSENGKYSLEDGHE